MEEQSLVVQGRFTHSRSGIENDECLRSKWYSGKSGRNVFFKNINRQRFDDVLVRQQYNG